MIGKSRASDGSRTFNCEDCHRLERYTSLKAAKAAGWAVSRDYTRCYCPMCAPEHRHVGRYGARA